MWSHISLPPCKTVVTRNSWFFRTSILKFIKFINQINFHKTRKRTHITIRLRLFFNAKLFKRIFQKLKFIFMQFLFSFLTYNSLSTTLYLVANNSLWITALQPKNAELIRLSCGSHNSILPNLELRQSCSEVAICSMWPELAARPFTLITAIKTM